MPLPRLAVSLAALMLVSEPVLAAPLSEDGVPSGAPETAAPTELPVIGARPTPPGRPLTDDNGNGLSDGLESLLESIGRGEVVDVIVTYKGQGDARAAERAVGVFTLRREFDLIPGFAATMTASQARALARAPGVFRVEEDATAVATLEAARRDFGVDALLDALDPSTQLPDGAGIEVCVIDTGVQGDHEQFTDASTGASRVVGFLDLVGDFNGVIRSVAYDDHGHGTHVSGIVAGDGTVGSEAGADPFHAPLSRGVAPAASLHVAKALNYNGVGPDSGIITAVDWCVAQGVDVVNMSLTIPGNSDGQDALSLAVNQAVAQGVVVVVGAGNAGDADRTIGSPAAAADAITVGAVAEHSPSTQSLANSPGVYPAPFTSRGPTADGRIKPDIAAPGVTILSAASSVVAVDPDPIFGGGGIIDLGCGVGCYNILSGTSMASPFVAGTVALMLDESRDQTTGLPTLTPAAAAQILADTAQERGVAGQDNVVGHGLLDVEAAVLAVDGMAAETAFPHTAFKRSFVANNGTVRIPVSLVDPAKPLAITVTIDGNLTNLGWSPDLDMWLLDEAGQPFLIANPLYPWLSSEPFIPAPGTSSTCPAGEDCGAAGAQETIHLEPSHVAYGAHRFLEVYPFDGWPNNGSGGSFTVELSNGFFDDAGFGGALVADAGPDLTVSDEDGDGFAEVTLDGRASGGLVRDYQWSGAAMASGSVATVVLPVGGPHAIDLTVGGDLSSSTDSVAITVTASSGDGGGGGNDKPCNPRSRKCQSGTTGKPGS